MAETASPVIVRVAGVVVVRVEVGWGWPGAVAVRVGPAVGLAGGRPPGAWVGLPAGVTDPPSAAGPAGSLGLAGSPAPASPAFPAVSGARAASPVADATIG